MAEHDSEVFVRITNRELYEVVIQVRDRMSSMENRLDNVLSENVELRRRLRALELKTYTLMAGAISGLLAGAGMILRGF